MSIRAPEEIFEAPGGDFLDCFWIVCDFWWPKGVQNRAKNQWKIDQNPYRFPASLLGEFWSVLGAKRGLKSTKNR